MEKSDSRARETRLSELNNYGMIESAISRKNALILRSWHPERTSHLRNPTQTIALAP